MFTVIGGKFKFQAQDSFSEYFFLEIWRSKKRIALSEKKPHLPTDKIQLGLHDMAITTFLFLSEILRTQTTKKEMSSSSKLRRQWCDSSRNGIKLFLKEHSITKLNLTLLVKFNSNFFSNFVCFSECPNFISKQIEQASSRQEIDREN